MTEVAKTRMFLGVIVLLLAGLGASLYEWSLARSQVEFFTSSNTALRNTLGDMTKALTAKEREIDRLSTTDCGGAPNPTPPPSAGEAPGRRMATR